MSLSPAPLTTVSVSVPATLPVLQNLPRNLHRCRGVMRDGLGGGAMVPGAMETEATVPVRGAMRGLRQQVLHVKRC